ncbi:MAG: HipA N-terminal domain-containing protein [Polyangiaceae bacterium]|jgi:HipA-like protein|nr:HipA N-terminal domain-containing protein [Polyangiaceae bacterium]
MSAPGTHVTLLHLSDIQLGKHHRFEPGTGQGSLLDRLREDLDERDREGLRPDLVLLTGDLAEWGLPSEFKQVEAFASALASHLGLRRSRIVLLPGNHDINRKASSSYFDQCIADEQRPVAPYWPKWRHFSEMFARFYEGEPGITFSQEYPWSLFEYPDLRLVVAALNSTIADSHRDEDHIAFVGEEQLRWFAERLRSYEEQSWLRIGAIHHDPARWREETREVPADKLDEVGRRVDQDLRDLERRLWPRLNLLVHGHIHEEQFRWLAGPSRAPVPALGIGSGGLNLAQRPAEVPNQYQWIRLYRDRLEYGSRAYVADQKRWIGDNRPDERGERWWLSTPYTPYKAEESFAPPGTVPSPAQEIAPRLARYRARLIKEHRSQGLWDVTSHYEDARIEGGLTLLDIFVPQHVAPMDPGSFVGAGEQRVLLPAGRSSRKSKAKAEGPPAPTSLEELLLSQAARWCFLIGAAGAGKSTLSRWLVLRLCDAMELPVGLEELVPVRLEMRLFEEARQQAKSSSREPPLLLEFIEQRHLRMDLPLSHEEIVSLAEQGKIYWIFDGLDEVASEKSRREIAEELGALHEKYSSCRGLITSRPGGLSPFSAYLASYGYEFFSLEPFDDTQIKDFLERWHSLAFPGNPEIAESRKQRLFKVVTEHTSVRELCTNPLLLTLVALINRGDELPRRRHKLYERATELMIVQWDANKGLNLPEASRFQPTDKWKLLRRIAWSMVNRRDDALNLELPNGAGNVIEQEHLERITEDFCKTHYSLESDEATRTAQQLLKHLRERNYVLALLGGTTFGFVHRTFLEYLAARELVERFRMQKITEEELSKVVQENQFKVEWEEPLFLTYGMLQEEQASLVVRLLQNNVRKLHLFAPHAYFEMSMYFSKTIRAFAELAHPYQEPAQSFAVKLASLISYFSFISRGISKLWDLQFPIPLHLCERGFPGRETLEGNSSVILNRNDGRVLYVLNKLNISEYCNNLIRLSSRRYESQITRKQISDYVDFEAGRVDRYSISDSTALLFCACHFSIYPLVAVNFYDWKMLEPGHEEDVRGMAAELFSRIHESERTVQTLEDIYQSSKLLSHRFRAARILEKEEYLRHLLEVAKKRRRPVKEPLSAWTFFDGQEVTAEKIEGLLRLKRRVRELIAVGRPRRAVVKRDGVRVGLLEETAGGTRFTYDEEYRKGARARAISPALPLRAEPFEQARGVLPFFSNLLPEGALLDSYCRNFALARSDVFGLLLVAARDVAGAVGVFPEEEEA